MENVLHMRSVNSTQTSRRARNAQLIWRYGIIVDECKAMQCYQIDMRVKILNVNSNGFQLALFPTLPVQLEYCKLLTNTNLLKKALDNIWIFCSLQKKQFLNLDAYKKHDIINFHWFYQNKKLNDIKCIESMLVSVKDKTPDQWFRVVKLLTTVKKTNNYFMPFLNTFSTCKTQKKPLP